MTSRASARGAQRRVKGNFELGPKSFRLTAVSRKLTRRGEVQLEGARQLMQHTLTRTVVPNM
jgi:hypothetical protein